MIQKLMAIMIVFVISLGFVSCNNKNEEDEGKEFEYQNIPSELCGTWYEVEKGSSYYQYLTINSDGTISASYYSDGSTMELKGKCFYKNGKMIFEYNNGGSWIQLYGAESTIVEWTSSNLILGRFNASFFSRTKDESPSFIGKDRDPELVGTWVYNQSASASLTVILRKIGTGNRTFISPVENTSKDIVNWFTRNSWIYIKYSGDTSYTLYRYNISGSTLYLYYCDILEITDGTYDYHKQSLDSY